MRKTNVENKKSFFNIFCNKNVSAAVLRVEVDGRRGH
jgi:hypothetical protein